MNRPMSAQALRDVAWALDALTKLTKVLYEPLAHMDEINAETLEITVTLSRNNRPLTPEDARTILEWVDSDVMQDDLRAWADTIDNGGTGAP